MERSFGVFVFFENRAKSLDLLPETPSLWYNGENKEVRP